MPCGREERTMLAGHEEQATHGEDEVSRQAKERTKPTGPTVGRVKLSVSSEDVLAATCKVPYGQLATE